VIVDAAVHPTISDAELRELMPRPSKYLPFAGPERYLYPVPGGEYAAGARDNVATPAATDPERVAHVVCEEAGSDVAILVPLTRGMQQDVDLGSAICAAINTWQSERWLADTRFRGSIRVNPQDPARAIAEIERWGDDERFVQIAVPAQSLAPYGQRPYFPIWEAAAGHDLPVHIQLDAAAAVEFWPTTTGYPTHYSEFATMQPLAGLYHMISLIAEGVMERLPRLKIVCGDGGHDLVGPTLWRFNKSWRGLRMEAPGAARPPGDYIHPRVRFLWHRWEGAADPEQRAAWAQACESESLTLYAGNYPYWDFATPGDAVRLGLTPRVLSGNALEFYGSRLAEEPVRGQG
jgi:predicted TIM-barrel fold metal-dependent hydrolase